MAGFASIDDLINQITTNGRFYRADFNKQTLAASAQTAGRWYELFTGTGYPMNGTWGEQVYNRALTAGYNYWTISSGWTWAAGVLTHAGAGVTTVAATLTKTPVAGRIYRVIYTISGYSSGTCTVSFGGQAGTGRTANGTYTENITAANSTTLTFTPSGTSAYSIGAFSVVELLQSYPMDDTIEGAMLHGGAVSTSTKHILNAGVVSVTATFAPSMFVLCDFLMCYPGFSMATASLQTFLNANNIPRYTDGKGVRAALAITTAAGSSAHNLAYQYTAPGPVTGRVNPMTVACTASAIVSHLTHAGVAANNYGPGLPLQPGDTGVLKMETAQLSATSTAGEAAFVLYKPLLYLPLTTAGVMSERDMLNQLPSLPQVVDGACLGWLLFAGAATAASSNAYGYVDLGWGAP